MASRRGGGDGGAGGGCERGWVQDVGVQGYREPGGELEGREVREEVDWMGGGGD